MPARSVRHRPVSLVLAMLLLLTVANAVAARPIATEQPTSYRPVHVSSRPQSPSLAVDLPGGPGRSAPSLVDAFAHLSPLTITATIGTKFTLNLMINSGSNTVVGQQSYLTFTNSLLQVVSPSQQGCVAASTVQADTSVFEAALQNQVSNTSGLIAYASGTFGEGAPPDSDFRVASITLCATAPGTATLHWQFQAPNRLSKITDPNSSDVENPALYVDAVVTAAEPPTATPAVTSTPVATDTPSTTATPDVPTGTPTSRPTNTLTNTPTSTPTDIPSSTSTSTHTPTLTATSTHTPTRTATPTPTNTPTPIDTPVETPTATPAALLVGHLTWQQIPQPDAKRNTEHITVTLKLGANSNVYYYPTTDASGFFTMDVSSLANGTYLYRVQGRKWLASGGNVDLLGASQTNLEVGTMRGGDAVSNNVVNGADFNALKTNFGSTASSTTDFNNDGVTNGADFNILKTNFGVAGPTPFIPFGQPTPSPTPTQWGKANKDSSNGATSKGGQPSPSRLSRSSPASPAGR